jgi:folate-binding protein YgfZ
MPDPDLGEAYLVNRPRTGSEGFEIFAPISSLERLLEKLRIAVQSVGGRACGWTALERVRIEAGIPRFGQDMDETTIPLEAGLENGGISFDKGCYIGQEIISRIRTYGQVAKALRRLTLAPDSKGLPVKGDEVLHEGKSVGHITSAAASPALRQRIALGYIRKEANGIGSEVFVRTKEGELRARISGNPFEPFEGGPPR